MSWGVKWVMAKDQRLPAERVNVHPNWSLPAGGARSVASQRITAPLEPFLRNGGIIAKSVGEADFGFPKLRSGSWLGIVPRP